MMREARENSSNNVHFQRPSFLPLLCSRHGVKNVTLPAKSHGDLSSSPDPLSPKISCIGQVKRSNKIVGFPATTTSFSINPAAQHRYFRLKRLFSGKNLTFSAPTTTTRTRTSRGRIKDVEFDNKRIAVIDVADLDPPLPVIKKKHDCGAGDKAAENLWKRRSGGGAFQLQSLQIQPNGPHQLKVTTV